MDKYSPITELKIRNFRQLGKVDIVFNRPIVTIVGENDAGKTSTILAFAVCGLNAYANKQKKYIKRGTQAFGLSLSLADGTEIRRIKASNQNTLQIIRNGESILDLAKFDNVSMQPQELEKVMGLIKDVNTNEILNIRTYNDRLIFAQTTAGDNYKIIYEMLKVSNLVKALKKGSEEANSLKKKINNNAILIENTLENLRDIKDVDTRPLLIVRDNLIKKIKAISRLEKCRDITVRLKAINEDRIKDIDSLKMIDVNLSNNLRIAKEMKGLVETSIPQIEDIKSIEVGMLEKLNRAVGINREKDVIIPDDIEKVETIIIESIEKLKRATDIKNSVGGVIDTEGLSGVDSNRYEKIVSIINKIKEIATMEERIKEMTEEAEKIKRELIDSGVKYKICSNCGEVVIIDE